MNEEKRTYRKNKIPYIAIEIKKLDWTWKKYFIKELERIMGRRDENLKSAKIEVKKIFPKLRFDDESV